MKCIIAEKPSVARDIARIVGATHKEEGCFSGNDHVVTWAFGHLVTLAIPEAYGFPTYSRDQLPIIPDPFRLVVRQIRKGTTYTDDPSALKQLGIIRKCFDRSNRIIVATDAGREGELIFRLIYAYLDCRKPFDRLWISSLTDKAIREGLSRPADGRQYDSLYLSGKARSEADWLVGINASRALSIARGGAYSLGRVQTPTLSMICRRYIEHRDFRSVPFWKIHALPTGLSVKAIEETTYESRKAADRAMEDLDPREALIVSSVSVQTNPVPPPLLYDLTALQKEANKRYGYTAEKTLSLAQSLYEKKCTTYPRTGSRYISEDIFEEIPSLLESLKDNPDYGDYVEKLTAGTLNRRSVDDTKVTDHHAILLTGEKSDSLTRDEEVLYRMITVRMLESFSEAAIEETLTATLTQREHRFGIKAKRRVKSGWKAVRGSMEEPVEEGETVVDSFPEWQEGDRLDVFGFEMTEHRTKPKPLYTEATLLSAMEHAGREVADEEARKALAGCGIGTPATRAAIIETLILREYIRREKKMLIPTEKGLSVYKLVAGRKIADAEMTGAWEVALAAIEAGAMDERTFGKSIEVYTRQICEELLTTAAGNTDAHYKTYRCPLCGNDSVRVFPKIVKCVTDGCGFKVFRELCGTLLSKEYIHALMTDGCTPLLCRLTGKSGKTFNARLKLDKDGGTSFVFDSKPRKPQT
ncbi:type IA DNA topoisomerase [Porphyromonas gingivalis]|uniref:type IA DNA topoisomerase n=1 Tax=Porphyromonas gingivalis TaxID=837 RepID=UPI000BE769AD|nr:type IA DNA topoisomerase [Porphyromonas gingivalis]PDP76783.1 DNA topoisomerase III [Porphyromonas gingivalis]